MSESYELRTATPNDADALVSFWTDAAENHGRPADRVVDVHRLLGRDPDSLLIADVDGEIVGTLIIGWDGWRFHLYRLAVRLDWRGRQVGRALVEEAERYCARLGGRRVDALVLDSNELGVGFWHALGYTLQPEWRRWVRSLP